MPNCTFNPIDSIPIIIPEKNCTYSGGWNSVKPAINNIVFNIYRLGEVGINAVLNTSSGVAKFYESKW